MCRRTTRSDSGPGGSRLTKSRAVTSMASGSRPACRAAARTTPTERGTSSGESQLRMTPSPTWPATFSIPSRSAATWMGTGSFGTRVSRNPSTVKVSPLKTTRSPASADRRNCAISRTRVAGRLNLPPFHDSTMGCDPAPIPSTKRPGATSASPAAVEASVAGPRV